jgi:hypothetical protein
VSGKPESAKHADEQRQHDAGGNQENPARHGMRDERTSPTLKRGLGDSRC